jgi:GAF domain-containing protein
MPQPFVRFTPRGETALAMVRSGEDRLVPNIDRLEPGAPDYRGSRGGYETFIACSITAGTKPQGMVTVDAPHPNVLSGPDLQIVGLVADLLAVAFALATRPQRGAGRAAGVGIKSHAEGAP